MHHLQTWMKFESNEGEIQQMKTTISHTESDSVERRRLWITHNKWFPRQPSVFWTTYSWEDPELEGIVSSKCSRITISFQHWPLGVLMQQAGNTAWELSRATYTADPRHRLMDRFIKALTSGKCTSGTAATYIALATTLEMVFTS